MIKVHVMCKSVTKIVEVADDANVRVALKAAQEAGFALGEDTSLLGVSDHYKGGQLTLDSSISHNITLDCKISPVN